MYFDSAYIAKFYVNEPDAPAVRAVLRRASDPCSSAWAIGEVTGVFHRHVREGSLSLAQGRDLMDIFMRHVETEVWRLIPVNKSLLLRVAKLFRGLPQDAHLRAGDAIHLATALDLGEPEIWTSDRHLLAAAARVGITGRSA